MVPTTVERKWASSITLEWGPGCTRLEDPLGPEHVEQLAVVALRRLAVEELGHRALDPRELPGVVHPAHPQAEEPSHLLVDGDPGEPFPVPRVVERVVPSGRPVDMAQAAAFSASVGPAEVRPPPRS